MLRTRMHRPGDHCNQTAPSRSFLELLEARAPEI
jgi:hypothetical protein